MAWKHDTPEKMREAGYGFVEWGYCRFCGVLIQWWHTKKAKLMPIDSSSIGENCEPRVMPHFATCTKWPKRVAAEARRADKEFLQSLGVSEDAPKKEDRQLPLL